MSDVPGARYRLRAIAAKLRDIGEHTIADEIADLVDGKLVRRSAARRMPIRSKPVTSTVKAQIIHLADTTELSSDQIAVTLSVNPGRVSEVLQGDR